MNAAIEKRAFMSEIETRADGDEKKISGVVLYGTPSKELGGFTEIIMPGAFDDVLKDDIRALFNHDPNLILGRTKSNTLKIQLTDRGLAFDILYPNTTYSNDLIESIQRGDIDATSFAFRTKEVLWVDEPDGSVTRKIMKFEILQDISPVTYPAYPDMEISLRAEYEAYKTAETDGKDEDIREDPDNDLAYYEKKLHLIKIK